MISDLTGKKDGKVLFNDAFNIFYSRVYGVKHMVKEHSETFQHGL